MEDTTIKELQINEEIRDKQVRLIGADGEQIGIVSVQEAQRIADEEGLDLVKISPQAVPPVCRIMNYSKYRYEQNKKEKEIKKNQKVIKIKEIGLSMTIDIGDLNTKMKLTKGFLADGDKVKVNIRMKGRQQAYAHQGVEVMNKFAEMLDGAGRVEKAPNVEGRNISMIIVPNTKK
ncbi:MAG: translation initiation factor IF-3 [Clostridia bacterium]|nr:translation initiation factor IF-3 [Clostridia bacterium]